MKNFDESLIQLKVEANDRIEAIRKSCKPLVDSGCISEEYIENIIKSMDKYGPYFVLMPRVAIPHARPEEGAIRNAIGITVLDQPVKFNSDENDPVKYIFPLSAVGNNDHLEALSLLSTLIDDKKFFEVLDNSQSPEEIIEYIINRKEELYV